MVSFFQPITKGNSMNSNKTARLLCVEKLESRNLLTGDLGYYFPLVEETIAQTEVVQIDQRGHGISVEADAAVVYDYERLIPYSSAAFDKYSQEISAEALIEVTGHLQGQLEATGTITVVHDTRNIDSVDPDTETNGMTVLQGHIEVTSATVSLRLTGTGVGSIYVAASVNVTEVEVGTKAYAIGDWIETAKNTVANDMQAVILVNGPFDISLKLSAVHDFFFANYTDEEGTFGQIFANKYKQAQNVIEHPGSNARTQLFGDAVIVRSYSLANPFGADTNRVTSFQSYFSALMPGKGGSVSHQLTASIVQGVADGEPYSREEARASLEESVNRNRRLHTTPQERLELGDSSNPENLVLNRDYLRTGDRQAIRPTR